MRYFLAAVVLAACIGCGQSAGVEDGPVVARVMAEEFVRRNVPHGLDASFPGITQVQESGRGTWVASGLVRAPNAAGAELTQPWTAEIARDGEDWVLRSLVLDGRAVR